MKAILIFLLFSASSLFAQGEESSFPFYVLGGERFTVPAKYDTVWVLNHNQYKNAIKTAIKQDLDSTMAAILARKTQLLNEILAEKDSVIALNREGYLHYRDLWEETDLKLEEAEIKAAQRWRFGLYGFYIGVGLSAVIFTALK
jgi:hypothetical protein